MSCVAIDVPTLMLHTLSSASCCYPTLPLCGLNSQNKGVFVPAQNVVLNMSRAAAACDKERGSALLGEVALQLRQVDGCHAGPRPPLHPLLVLQHLRWCPNAAHTLDVLSLEQPSV